MKAKKKSSAKKKAVKTVAKSVVSKVKAAKKKRPSKAAVSSAPEKKVLTKQKIEELEIPPILLEGDMPEVSAAQGLKYALGPEPVQNHFQQEESYELPESYGTGKMFVTARDPHWIYAAWDLSTAKIKQYNKLSSRGRMTLRVYMNDVSTKPQSEIDLYTNSRDWFVRVDVPGQKYIIALGYYDRNGVFNEVTTSEPVWTPNVIAPQTQTFFHTKPEPVAAQPLSQQRFKEQFAEKSEMSAIFAKTTAGKESEAMPRISQEEQRELVRLVYSAVQRGSIELVKVEKVEEAAPFISVPTGQPVSQQLPLEISVSSPKGGFEQKRKFWFNIQAELIVYGATEPDAEVIVGGEKIKLRPDGTFTLRFALPDGFYKILASAISKSGEERRSVNLEFARTTTSLEGEVGECPADKSLKPPR
ncbi:MAG: DUF4912 domain-containing protein [Verrucomicrobiia bacterium]